MGRRLGVAVEATFSLFVVSAAMEWLILRDQPIVDRRMLAVAASVPALASLSLLVLAAFIPALFPCNRLAAPGNIALPIAHSGLMVVFSKLILTTSNPLQSVQPQLRAAVIWQEWRVLGLNLVLQIVCLTVLVLLSAPKKQVPS